MTMHIMETKPLCWTDNADKLYVFLQRDVEKKRHMDSAGKPYTLDDFDSASYGCDGNNNEINLKLTPACRTCAKMIYSQTKGNK